MVIGCCCGVCYLSSARPLACLLARSLSRLLARFCLSICLVFSMYFYLTHRGSIVWLLLAALYLQESTPHYYSNFLFDRLPLFQPYCTVLLSYYPLQYYSTTILLHFLSKPNYIQRCHSRYCFLLMRNLAPKSSQDSEEQVADLS